MKKNILFLIIVVSYCPIFAQLQGMQLIDSLKSELNKAKEDTNTVKLMANLSKEYYRFDTKQGVYFGKQALALAEELNYNFGIALANNNIGINYAVLGDLVSALEFFHKSLDMSIKINDEQGVANLSNNIGNIYRKINQFEKSINYLKKAIEINLKLNNSIDLYKGYSNLGLTYSMIPEIKSSNEYFFKAMELAESINNPEFKYQSLINLSKNYSLSGDNCKALELSFEAFKICENFNYDYDKATIAGDIGLTFYAIAFDSLTVSKDCSLYPRNKIALLKESEYYLLRALEYLKNVNDYSQIQDYAYTLSLVYEYLGNHKQSLNYFKIYKTAFDSINFKNNSQKFENLENKREIELRDNQIKIQTLEIEKKDAQLIFQIMGFVLIIVLIFIVVFIAYIRFSRKKEQETINAQKLADEAISENQRILKLISDNLQKTYIFQFKMDKNRNFSFLYISSGLERVHYGIHIDDILKDSSKLLNTIDDELKEPYYRKVIASAETLTDFSMDLKMRTQDSNYIWISVHSTPRLNENGELFWDGSAIDITDRKIAEEELIIAKSKAEEYEKLKSAFLQNISHEIRTPLNGILGFSNLLGDDDLEKEEKEEYLNMIIKSGKRLELMVDNIIEVSKITSGQISIFKKEFQIKTMIDEIIDNNFIFANEKHINLNIELNNCLKNSIYSDKLKLELVFNSLVSNAIKFTPIGGTIEIGVIQKPSEYTSKIQKTSDVFETSDVYKDDCLYFYVKDNGIGIDKSLHEKIFDNFFQADSSISRQFEGAGLGLSICKGILDLLGGKIWVESEVGKGSTFLISLPI